MKSDAIRARIVDKAELRKSPAERQAEALLKRLNSDNAIEVDLDGTSARTVRRAFSKAAANLGVRIQVRAKDDKVHIILKQSVCAEATE